MKTVLLILMGTLIVGCSNRAVYDNIQMNNRKECAKLPPSQYDECVAATRKTYDEYTQERKELFKNN